MASSRAFLVVVQGGIGVHHVHGGGEDVLVRRRTVLALHVLEIVLPLAVRRRSASPGRASRSAAGPPRSRSHRQRNAATKLIVLQIVDAVLVAVGLPLILRRAGIQDGQADLASEGDGHGVLISGEAVYVEAVEPVAGAGQAHRRGSLGLDRGRAEIAAILRLTSKLLSSKRFARPVAMASSRLWIETWGSAVSATPKSSLAVNPTRLARAFRAETKAIRPDL